MAASSSKMLQVARKTGRKADQRKTKRKKSNSQNSYRPLTSDYHDVSTNVMVVNTFLLEIDVNHIVCIICIYIYIYTEYIYIYTEENIYMYIYIMYTHLEPCRRRPPWNGRSWACSAGRMPLVSALGWVSEMKQLKPKFTVVVLIWMLAEMSTILLVYFSQIVC